MGITYRKAGVSLEAGDVVVDRIRKLVGQTTRPEVVAGVGGFASLCRLPEAYQEPLLVSGTDGVGTKLQVAFLTGTHDTIGLDLVAMCVNDVITCGAEPLFFLDYFATGALNPDVAEAVVSGIAVGCREAGCALVGGETAELPGFYRPGEYDLAGFCVGVVERRQVIDGSTIRPKDAVVGIASSGLHSNGYSLARHVLLEHQGLALDERPPELGGVTLGEELLRPTKIYARLMRQLSAVAEIRGVAHITGGGLPGNAGRTLPEGLGVRLWRGSWPVPPIFDLIARGGSVAPDEMARTFNLGLGLCVTVPPTATEAVLGACTTAGAEAYVVGEIVEVAGGASRVEIL